MRGLAVKDLYKNYLHLQPSQSQRYQAYGNLPSLLKVFMGIFVDARLVSKRKYYLMGFGLVKAVIMFYLSIGVCDSAL